MPEENHMNRVVQPITRAQEQWDRWPSGTLAGSVEGASDDRLSLEGVLPREEFLERLRFEKRRVDRSGTPLSMALFFLKDELLKDTRKLREFLVSIKRDTRETDLKGWVNGNIFGLLMLDTDGPGAYKCVELLTNGKDGTVGDVLTGTYPDRLFNEILEKTGAEPRIFSLESLETESDLPLPQILKRGLDILGALLGIICLSPIMLITAVAIKLTSPGPVIFRQTRMGKRGKHFSFLKFRSMTAGNDDRVHREYVLKLIDGQHAQLNQGQQDKPLYKLKHDTRITPVGRIIRKLSLDELPQLFNVLKGEMSLVGPRPPIPYEVENYKAWHLRRILEVKPGITGLWQVEGRSQTSFDDMVRLDIRYVQTWSLWLDLKILFKTVREVLFPKGAL
jgi:lipopolysaccharide/colanic/teichoic acid biosynthesis glycosyltransferase